MSQRLRQFLSQRLRLSLRWRLVLVVVATVGITGGWLGWRLAEAEHIRFQQAAEEHLIDVAQVLAAVSAELTPAGATEPDVSAWAMAWPAARRAPLQAKIYERSKNSLDLDVSITDRHGIVRFDSLAPETVGHDHAQWNDVKRTLAGRYGARATRSDPHDRSTAVLHVAAPITAHGQILGVLTVRKPVAAWDELSSSSRSQIMVTCAVAAMAAAVVLIAATVLITEPLARLYAWIATARDVRIPVPNHGPPEIRALAQRFADVRNELIDREGLDRHVLELTHELKSPLAGIRAAAELLADDGLETADRHRLLANLSSESQRLADLAERLLLLSRIERMAQPQREPVALTALIRHEVETVRAQARQRHIAVAVQADEELSIHGDPFLLAVAVRNLLANAITHSPDGGAISISVRRAADAAESAQSGRSHVQLLVLDRGAGIPAHLRPRLFTRFAAGERPDGQRGTGLGLALVRSVAEVHGGTITASDRPGGGTSMCLELPG